MACRLRANRDLRLAQCTARALASRARPRSNTARNQISRQNASTSVELTEMNDQAEQLQRLMGLFNIDEGPRSPPSIRRLPRPGPAQWTDRLKRPPCHSAHAKDRRDIPIEISGFPYQGIRLLRMASAHAWTHAYPLIRHVGSGISPTAAFARQDMTTIFKDIGLAS